MRNKKGKKIMSQVDGGTFISSTDVSKSSFVGNQSDVGNKQPDVIPKPISKPKGKAKLTYLNYISKKAEDLERCPLEEKWYDMFLKWKHGEGPQPFKHPEKKHPFNKHPEDYSFPTDDDFVIRRNRQHQNVVCEVCGCIRKDDNHDCLKSLREAAHLQELEMKRVKEEHGHDVEYVNPRCQQDHLMKFQRGTPVSHENYRYGANCDECKQKNLVNQEFFYHCKDCEYDLCRQCALVQANIITREVHSQFHSCPLKITAPSNDYRCDLSQDKQKKLGLSCLSGHTDFYQGRYTQRWYCRQCDFDICLSCCLKYAFIDLDYLRYEDAQTAYFVLQAYLDGPQDESQIFVNKFFKIEDAQLYFNVLWKMNSKKMKSYAILVRRGEILQKFGYLNQLENLIDNLNGDDPAFQQFRKITGSQLIESPNLKQFAILGMKDNDDPQDIQSSLIFKSCHDREDLQDSFKELFDKRSLRISGAFKDGLMVGLINMHDFNQMNISRNFDAKYYQNFLVHGEQLNLLKPKLDIDQKPKHAVYWVNYEESQLSGTHKKVVLKQFFENPHDAINLYASIAWEVPKIGIINNQCKTAPKVKNDPLTHHSREFLQICIDSATVDGMLANGGGFAGKKQK